MLPPIFVPLEPNLPEYYLPESFAAESNSLFVSFLLCLELFIYPNLLPDALSLDFYLGVKFSFFLLKIGLREAVSGSC